MAPLTVLFLALLTTSIAVGTEKKSSRNFDIEVSGANCSGNFPTVRSFECSYERLGASCYVFRGNCMFSQELKPQFDVRLRVDLLHTYARTALRALDVRLNVCQMLDSLLEFAVLRTLMEELRRTSNLPARCPFKANTLYKYQNFSFTPNSLPAYMPDSNFTFSLEFLDGQTLLASEVVWGSVSSRLYARKWRPKRI